ncbi:hypothetical protein [Burkholderia gladioli]|uniref:hypothetical protein n=1 Tax=Burkholderia gladioli TaxID=28095 RepID=UPI0016401F0A|nr:hypothetical protein [Burkholderia gladioli]
MNETHPSHLCPDQRMADIVDAMQADDETLAPMLDEVRQTWPEDHRLAFLRGAVLAGAAQYEAARADFLASLALAPGFSIACFMLGFLDLTNGQVERAIESWQPLDALPVEDTLLVLKTGLLNLVEDRFELAIAQLRAGMASNERYPLINRYIADLLRQLEAAAPQAKPVEPPTGDADILVGNLPFPYSSR